MFDGGVEQCNDSTSLCLPVFFIYFAKQKESDCTIFSSHTKVTELPHYRERKMEEWQQVGTLTRFPYVYEIFVRIFADYLDLSKYFPQMPIFFLLMQINLKEETC